jgi:hypothetical protein
MHPQRSRAGLLARKVNAAVSGDTISVHPATYKEDVTISGKWLKVRAVGADSVVDAAGKNNGITITGRATRGTSVTGFTVENANLEGILLQDTANILIDRNTVKRNDRNLDVVHMTCAGALPFEQDDCGEGVHLNGVDNAQVSNNDVEHNAGGILLTDEAAATHDNVIANNRVLDNHTDCGITLASHPVSLSPYTPGHTIYRNLVIGNVSKGNGGAGAGIFTPTPGEANYDNSVVSNVLKDNVLPGVALHAHAPHQNLNGNVIIGNWISGNGPDDGVTTKPTGITIFSDNSAGASPITGMTIAGNTVVDENIDVWFGTTETNLSLHDNNLLGSKSVGVQSAGTGTIDATENYWGCAGGPPAKGCSSIVGSHVKFTPWLTSKVIDSRAAKP